MKETSLIQRYVSKLLTGSVASFKQMDVLLVRPGQQAVGQHLDLGTGGVKLWFTGSLPKLNVHFLNVPLNK